MGEAGARGLTPGIALRLGRVSNLPTVWTNVLAGLALAGAAFSAPMAVVLAVAFSLYYVAGMYLNDAFDRDIDARERPERPIPSGAVSARTVFGAGFALLAAGWLLLLAAGYALPGGTGWPVPLAGLALAGAIVLYDLWHKGNTLSPVLMGVCRMLVYVGSAVAVAGDLPLPAIVAALVALAYLIGLTYAAKQESRGHVAALWPFAFLAVPVGYALWVAVTGVAGAIAAAAFLGWLGYALSLMLRPGRTDIPRAVVTLIAGICLLDAVFLVGAGHATLAIVAGAAFLLTLTLQRHIAGT